MFTSTPYAGFYPQIPTPLISSRIYSQYSLCYNDNESLGKLSTTFTSRSASFLCDSSSESDMSKHFLPSQITSGSTPLTDSGFLSSSSSSRTPVVRNVVRGYKKTYCFVCKVDITKAGKRSQVILSLSYVYAASFPSSSQQCSTPPPVLTPEAPKQENISDSTVALAPIVETPLKAPPKKRRIGFMIEDLLKMFSVFLIGHIHEMLANYDEEKGAKPPKIVTSPVTRSSADGRVIRVGASKSSIFPSNPRVAQLFVKNSDHRVGGLLAVRLTSRGSATNDFCPSVVVHTNYLSGAPYLRLFGVQNDILDF
ncbi:unnamed protein product [Angiostrongylus costaricensis]|uniref:DUF4210 domain-containing protein n=1 Tax=Angiostrongylus costaricensis TaxID=334426 RepID=A0A158PJL9_ANGCS|nr:unnamed protein product [Angiostrongylus costaricensis]